MSYEFQNIPNHIVERLNRVSLPAIELFTNQQKFEFYMYFMRQYAGEPHNEKPELKRERGGSLVTYDAEVVSAMTDDASHFVHIRQGTSPEGVGLNPIFQYLPVTADFETFGVSELWVTDVIKNKIHEPNRLELVLSHQPVHEPNRLELVVDNQLAREALAPVGENHELLSLEAIGLRRVQELAHTRRIAQSIRFLHENQRSYFTWGSGTPVKSFHSIDEIQHDLWALQKAEEQGILDDGIRSHQSVREYLGRTA